MIIGIDLDDVLADSITQFISFHNSNYGTNISKEDFSKYTLNEIIGLPIEEEAKRLALFDESIFFEEINPLIGSLEIIKNLGKTHRLIVITARPKNIQEKTRKWILKYFPEIKDIYFIRDHYEGSSKTKGEICQSLGVDIMIEDNLNYAIDCVNKKIKVILFDYPWNQTEMDYEGIKRVFDWHEALKIIEKISERRI